MNAPGPAPFGALATDLRRMHEESFTGSLRVFGPPDTTLHFHHGLVIAVPTPAAPGPDTLLLRTGTVGADTWATARERALATGDLGAELLDRGHVSAALLELALTRSVLDGVFAMGLTPSNRGGQVLPGALPPLLRLDEGIDPDQALREAARRHTNLTHRWGPPADLARLRPAAEAAPERAPSRAHHDLLLRADGRRTPRDLAFVLGREVSAVMADLTRLAERGLIDLAERHHEGALTRRLPESRTTEEKDRPLVRRTPGANGMRRAPRADATLPTALPADLAARLQETLRAPGDLLEGDG
ncbi:hypothetical protein [Nocardiopsis sp. JB363]|uniref:hypothetical protein n=1 Tax=Nocardiopsis sp. JB363 TaxID=1434837 RepID=UPI00097A9093|nr:hypothetical protein [Nocardiopsis sp. JB363]SIO85720.1 hypothetical protein BQ8420_08375 [Nocardiopsis sp. JB363]